MIIVRFETAGLPIAQGSKKVVPTAAGHRAVEGNEGTLKPWRHAIAGDAMKAMGDRPPVTGAVRLELRFQFPRPAAHYGTGRNAGILKASAPSYRSSAPDIDKLSRAVLDALAGIVYRNDAQVAELRATKLYGPPSAAILAAVIDNHERGTMLTETETPTPDPQPDDGGDDDGE